MPKNAGNNGEFLRDLLMDSFYILGFLILFDIACEGQLRQWVATKVGPVVDRTMHRIALEKKMDKLVGPVLWDAMETVEQSKTEMES